VLVSPGQFPLPLSRLEALGAQQDEQDGGDQERGRQDEQRLGGVGLARLLADDVGPEEAAQKATTLPLS
jgi:hypothetical protein